MDKSTLDTILEYDEHNLGESRKMFRDYGLLDPFERMPGLLESLRLAIEPHLAADPHALGRPDTSGTLKPRYETILRVYMHLSAWHQFVMTTGHLFRGCGRSPRMPPSVDPPLRLGKGSASGAES